MGALPLLDVGLDHSGVRGGRLGQLEPFDLGGFASDGLGDKGLGPGQDDVRALGCAGRCDLASAEDLVVGLDPATIQPDVAGIGEDAHPEFGGETTGDIPVVVGLTKEDQVR